MTEAYTLHNAAKHSLNVIQGNTVALKHIRDILKFEAEVVQGQQKIIQGVLTIALSITPVLNQTERKTS